MTEVNTMTDDDLATDLASTDLFGHLPGAVRDRLASRSARRTMRRGELVFAQGEEAADLYVVHRGRIAIAARASDGRESVVAVLDSGAVFGEMPFFDPAPRSADARALADAEVVAVPYEAMHEVLDDDPELLWALLKILARRLRTTDEALADSVFLDVTARTAKRLIELAGDADEFQLALTQEELAGLVGASRERVNKALATFVRLGWLEIDGRSRYRFVDRQALADRADL